jgi:DNA invertase Pin-like site-specific DNA recombinase
VIATYANLHQLSIVRTYRDEGESGLKLKNRTGLIQLLEDVRTGHADFDHILVYDVNQDKPCLCNQVSPVEKTTNSKPLQK